jgi:predicted methyltransferase MtxX (methanogen marker protein 4)
MSDMAGNAARVAVECGGRCRDTNRQSEIRRILFKNKDDQFRTGA